MCLRVEPRKRRSPAKHYTRLDSPTTDSLHQYLYMLMRELFFPTSKKIWPNSRTYAVSLRAQRTRNTVQYVQFANMTDTKRFGKRTEKKKKKKSIRGIPRNRILLNVYAIMSIGNVFLFRPFAESFDKKKEKRKKKKNKWQRSTKTTTTADGIRYLKMWATLEPELSNFIP